MSSSYELRVYAATGFIEFAKRIFDIIITALIMTYVRMSVRLESNEMSNQITSLFLRLNNQYQYVKIIRASFPYITIPCSYQ